MKPNEIDGHSPGVALRSLVIGLTAFLTVVDLFATQAILPSLTRHYDVTPAAMGFAVNASTMGMAIAGLVVGFFSPHIDRRLGILVSLVLLAIPTTLLAVAPDLTAFTILRVAQGLCMASAFALTLAYLGEQCSSMDAGGAFAAYITGNVASNLIGRLISAAVADTSGLPPISISLRCSILPARCWSISPSSASNRCMRCPRRSRRLPRRCALAQSGASRGLRYRLLHPVRLYRHLHLRQFRARPPAAVARHDGPGLRLFRLPAIDRHDAAGRQGGRALRHAAHDLGALAVAALGLPLMLSSHLPQCWPVWCWSAPEHSSRRPARPALSDRPPAKTAASPAAPISPAISSAASSAARCSASFRPLRLDRLRRRRRRFAGPRNAVDH